MLALFFGVVAVVLAGLGLYGVLLYSVLERQREIGIRMAVGAQLTAIVRMVTIDVSLMVLAGAAAGLTCGLVLVRYTAELFYEVKPTDLAMLALPKLALLGTAVLAASPGCSRGENRSRHVAARRIEARRPREN